MILNFPKHRGERLKGFSPDFLDNFMTQLWYKREGGCFLFLRRVSRSADVTETFRPCSTSSFL